MTDPAVPVEELPDPLADDQQVVYDTTTTAKPFLSLRAAIREFLSAAVETVGRDPEPVVDPLAGDDAWWMRVGTQSYLAAVHLAAEGEGIVRLDVIYDFDATESVSLPGPDALPAVDKDDELTVTLVFDESRPVTPDVDAPTATADGVTFATAREQRVDPDEQPRAKTTPVGERPKAGDGDDEPNAGSDDDSPSTGQHVTVTAVGPDGDGIQVDLNPDARIGKLVATVIRETDGGVSPVELSHDERGRESVDSDTPAAEFDGERLHWRPVERLGVVSDGKWRAHGSQG